MSIKNSDDPIRLVAQCLKQLRHRVTLFYCQMKAVHILRPTFFQQKQICICKKKTMSTQLALKAAQNSRGDTGVTWLITFRGLKGWGANRPLVLATLTLRRLMSYIYGAPVLDVSRSHTTTQHSR